MTTRPQVLQNGPLTPALEAALAAEFDVTHLSNQADPQAFLATHGARFTGLSTSAPAGASAALLAALPGLRVISSHGVGLDKIDLEVAAQRNIAVGYTPDVLNDCVAERRSAAGAGAGRFSGQRGARFMPTARCRWTPSNAENRIF